LRASAAGRGSAERAGCEGEATPLEGMMMDDVEEQADGVWDK
jgi:hypothetical protein